MTQTAEALRLARYHVRFPVSRVLSACDSLGASSWSAGWPFHDVVSACRLVHGSRPRCVISRRHDLLVSISFHRARCSLPSVALVSSLSMTAGHSEWAGLGRIWISGHARARLWQSDRHAMTVTGNISRHKTNLLGRTDGAQGQMCHPQRKICETVWRNELGWRWAFVASNGDAVTDVQQHQQLV